MATVAWPAAPSAGARVGCEGGANRALATKTSRCGHAAALDTVGGEDIKVSSAALAAVAPMLLYPPTELTTVASDQTAEL